MAEPKGGYKRIIEGKVVRLRDPAPSTYNSLLAEARKYLIIGDVVPLIQYLISSTPIDEEFWRTEGRRAGNMRFKYGNKQITIYSPMDAADCMIAVLDGRLDISEWVHDLYWLAWASMNDIPKRDRFLAQVRKKVSHGLTKYVI